ncbi:nmrA-family protein [Mycena leptocephala]|nr:nmrA-family protein [Mycena leptocephala]
MPATKLILVIGATGAQGQVVVEALLAPDAHGNPSPYSVRVFTRDPTSKHALELTAQGSFEDFDSVADALEGAYGAWARVADWLRAQPSIASEDDLSWSIVTTGPYMELLMGGLFDPLNVRADGTVVFAAPVAGGQIPMIALKDLGWWARYTFDHRTETSGQELIITSERVGWEYLVETFKKVTSKPAVFKPQSLDEWWGNFDDRVDGPVASDKKPGDGSRTIRDNFSAFWRVLRDDVVQKDIEVVKLLSCRCLLRMQQTEKSSLFGITTNWSDYL